jgi:hypothetical protein
MPPRDEVRVGPPAGIKGRSLNLPDGGGRETALGLSRTHPPDFTCLR